MKKFFLAGAMAVLPLVAPSYAEEPAASGLSQSDIQAIDNLINPVLAGIATQRHRAAITTYFLTNARMKEKPGEIELFLTQVDGAFALYGKASNCSLIEKVDYGAVAQRRLYICQHDTYLTRWVFEAFKSSRGWMAGNLRYDDKYTLDASQ